VENNVTSSKFVLDNVPFRLSKSNKLAETQNVSNKYSHKISEAPKQGISVVLPN